MDMEHGNCLTPKIPESVGQALLKILHGGVAGFALAGHTLLFATPEVAAMLGYAQDELNQQGEDWFWSKVVPEDLEHVHLKLEQLASQGGTVEEVVRLRRKDGSLLWVRQYAGLAEDKALGRYILCLMVECDGVDQRECAEAERGGGQSMTMHRYQDIVFEWDMQTDMVAHFGNIREKLGYDLPKQSMQQLIDSGVYLKEDLPLLQDTLARARGGAEKTEVELRLNKRDGAPLWVQYRGTTIFDENGAPVQMVGVLNDIDRLKRENDKLKRKAQTDLLTGLLNRISAEEQIRHILAQYTPEKYHAFFLVDVDNFKEINDSAGHDVGDVILSTISRRIRSRFREEDVMGRMGGDEFVLFFTDLSSMNKVRERAQRLSRVFDDQFLIGAKSQTVTCSIGVSICPDHGKTFEELYHQADLALYRAKKAGRNRWVLYTAEDKAKQ